MIASPQKAKRKLTSIDFSGETSHIALVSKDQGGPASGADYKLVMKSNSSFTSDVIEKAQQIKVTMDLPEFLNRFFGLYGTDCEVLARMLGYVPPINNDEDWYEDYIEEKLASFEIMKSLHEQSIPEVMSKLTGDEYLAVLKDQSLVEKALRKKDRLDKQAKKISAEESVEEGSTEAVAKAKKSDDKNPAEVEPSGVNKTEKNMELEELQKSFTKQQEELQKALDVIKSFQEKEKAAVIKSKTEQITALVQDEKQASVLIKAGLALESDEDFSAFVETVKTIHSQVEQSSLFKETGVTSSADKTDKKVGDGVAALLKAQHNVK